MANKQWESIVGQTRKKQPHEHMHTSGSSPSNSVWARRYVMDEAWKWACVRVSRKM